MFAERFVMRILKEPTLEGGFYQWVDDERFTGYAVLAVEFLDTIKTWIALILVCILIDGPTIEYLLGLSASNPSM